ncbi:MAG: Wzz/FepE/Etk N-terminal domain-containing protein [Aliidongia sp.]
MTGGMSLREVLAIAFREKRKIIIAALIPPVIAIGLLLVLKPTYRAETGLVIKTGREYIAAGQGQSSALGPSSTLQEEVNTEIQIMTSRGRAGEGRQQDRRGQYLSRMAGSTCSSPARRRM